MDHRQQHSSDAEHLVEVGNASYGTPYEEGSWDGTCGGVGHLFLSPSNRYLEEEEHRTAEAARGHGVVVGQHRASIRRGVPSDDP